MNKIRLLGLLLAFGLEFAVAQGGAGFEGPKKSFHGFDQFDFKVEEVGCRVVVPETAAEGKPWVIRARFWGHEPQLDKALLSNGWHVAYANVSGLFGNPEAVRRWDVLYDHLTTEHGFSKRVALEGFSRGGLIVYAWGAKHPERVRLIYGDAPVCDIHSWPRGRGEGKGSAGTWRQCLEKLGLTEETAEEYKGTPIDLLEPLAKAKVPIIHVVGEADKVVPVAENTDVVAARYEELGGAMEVIRKPDCDHHPHSLKDPAPLLAFFLKHE